ncbi:MAG: protein kinase domain-containing protein, partial [Paracoccaceae bacterium]
MLETGTVVQDRYRVVRLLGEGGMGSVYRAWDLRLKVPVALKELRPQPGLDEEMLQGLREQFEQEAAVLARLNHPSLVRVTDYFEEQSNAYLVMDFVDGRSLVDIVIQEGAQPEGEVLEWARQLLEALAYCHAQGVVHRDIKPQNIIVKPDGNAVLVDFGLVKLWDPTDPRTRTVMRGMGTPEYAPPEQYGAVTDHTGPPSDIYSLGATLYHLLTGRAPATATERMAMPESFRPLRELAPQVSERVERLVMKALSLSVSERWQTAREMLAVLVSGPLPAYETVAAPAPITPTVMAPAAVHQPAAASGPSRAAGDVAPSAKKRPKRIWIGIAVVALGCVILACVGYLFGRPLLASLLDLATATLAPTVTVAPTATEAPVAVEDTPAAESASSETPAVGGFTIKMQNRSPDEVCYVLISPSDSDQWGEDWLGGDEVIASGGERTFD